MRLLFFYEEHTHARTHTDKPKPICPHFFKVEGIIKNTTYVEANVLSMYAKFLLHPIYGF